MNAKIFGMLNICEFDISFSFVMFTSCRFGIAKRQIPMYSIGKEYIEYMYFVLAFGSTKPTIP